MKLTPVIDETGVTAIVARAFLVHSASRPRNGVRHRTTVKPPARIGADAFNATVLGKHATIEHRAILAFHDLEYPGDVTLGRVIGV